MDKLDQIFAMQAQLNQSIRDKRNLHDIPSEQWIQRQILATISELSEVLDEVNFKWWKNPKEIEPAKLKEELVDVLHFVVSMCLEAGLTADELHQIYLGKHQVNLERQAGAWGDEYKATE